MKQRNSLRYKIHSSLKWSPEFEVLVCKTYYETRLTTLHPKVSSFLTETQVISSLFYGSLPVEDLLFLCPLIRFVLGSDGVYFPDALASSCRLSLDLIKLIFRRVQHSTRLSVYLVPSASAQAARDASLQGKFYIMFQTLISGAAFVSLILKMAKKLVSSPAQQFAEGENSGALTEDPCLRARSEEILVCWVARKVSEKLWDDPDFLSRFSTVKSC